MLQAIETTPQKYTTKNTLTQTPSSSANKAQTTPNTPPTANNQSQGSASVEEKQQRRRSTFYVPLVIEDDDSAERARPQSNGSSYSGSLVHVAGGDTSSLGGQSNASNATSSSAALEQKSSSSSSIISVGGGKSKAEKNCNNNSLKKSTSLKNASATSKVAALLFERTNSTLGFGAGTSAAQTSVVKRNSSAKKMSPPCGFNWAISGTTVDTDLDDESDAAEGVVATPAKKAAEKEKSKLSKLAHKPEKRHSMSSKSSVASSIAATSTPTANKQQAQPAHKANTNAKTKRYGIVLNGISLDEEHLNITQASTTPKSTPIKGRGNLVEFNEDDIVLATPTKQARTTASSKQAKTVNSKRNNGAWGDTDIDVNNVRTSHVDMDSEESKHRIVRARGAGMNYNNEGGECSDADTNNDDSEHDDEDDDSEISRMQTNTSTPIKMMKSRSRTNILSVPSVEQHNLLSVAAAAAKPSNTTHTTPLLLRAKSKTLPQNLSPSVVLQQPEALYGDCVGTQTKTKVSGTESSSSAGQSRTSRLIGPLSKVHHNLFGGSVASHIGGNSATNNTTGGASTKCVGNTQPNKLMHSSSASLITQTFPPKHLFLLKSTSKLPVSSSSSSSTASSSLEHNKSKASKSFSSDTSFTSPAAAVANASAAQTVTSPPKKSLSFIRRAHSTKLSRNNSLLKSIANQHQQNIQQAQQSNNMAGSWIVDCSGSWGKDFYLNYDVCPLALDELESYFRSERCTTLIRERFKISDIPLNCSAADESHNQQDSLLRELDASSGSQQHLRAPGATEACGGMADDDDTGHHSETTVNSRKSALENTRERLKDDSGEKTQQSRATQQEKNLNNGNMDAAATTTTATTTKHYNKTTKLQNNHRRGTYRTQSGETNDNVKVQKQTAKQAKAAAQRAAAVAAFAATQDSGGNNNNKATSGAKDPLAIGNDSTTTTAAVQQQSGATSGGKAARAKEAREQKTIAKQDASGVATARGNNAAAAVASTTTINAINSTTATTSGNNNTNNNNNKHSDNSNSSFSKNNITLSQNEVLARKSDKPQQQRQEVNNSDNKAVAGIPANNRATETISNAVAAPIAAPPAAEPSTWNNSRYLHKKFKRLASTTDVDSIVADSQSVNNAGSSASSEAGSEAAQTRTTSLSSSASTSSISPPPASTPTPTPSGATTPAAAVNASNAQALPTTTNVIASATLMNGHGHASPPAALSTIEQMNYKNSNKSESNNNNNDTAMSLAYHSDAATLQLNAQQQYEAEQQLPQTMLHLMENQQSQQNNGNGTASVSASSGRYVCPYCNLNCTKPSVLQKHIRAHTNERPYPCDICGIAFKTNSNYYKHCRSRSHAARKRGIEVPISAEDGLFGGSDQEGDPELSNSSSDVISRTASPLDEVSSLSAQANTNTYAPATSMAISPQQLHQLQQQQQKQIQLQQQQHQLNLAIQQQQTAAAQSPHHSAPPSTPSPSSISSTKSAYLQQPAQQPHQLPLGSPAAGTLPPPTSTSAATSITAVTSTNKHVGNAVTEHKPYKPKFHNAALYATTKEAAKAAAAAQAAAAAAAAGMPPSSMPPGLLQPLPLQQQQPQPLQQQQQQQQTQQQHLTPQLPQQQQQHNAPAFAQHLSMHSHPQTQAPTQLSQAPTPTHHPSLSPSTQVKLNNHINTHQLQLQMQQQQQQQPLHILPPLNAGLPLHHHVAPMSPKSATQRPDLMNAAAVAAAANMGYLATPRMIYPGAMDFPPEALHLMMPESRQKLQYQVQQYKWLEQELQQHLHTLNQQQQVQQQQQQLQLQHLQAQAPLQPPNHAPPNHAPPTPPTILKPTPTLPMHARALSNPQHTTAPPPITAVSPAHSTQAQPLQQAPLQYLVNTVAAAQQPSAAAVSVNSSGMVSMTNSAVTTNNSTASKSAGLLHSNISNVASGSSANKVADLVQEHISKLISQNEAIVENKAVLLQKKYPKGLNRSRSFNNSGNGLPTTTSNSSNAGGSGGGSVNLVTATSVSNESATNARLAQAIVQKQQQQQQLQQQLQQQQHYQQQFQQQLLAGAAHMPPPPGQHHQLAQQQQQQQQHHSQLRYEEHQQQQQQQQQHQFQQQQQLTQPNGISKHLTASIATKAANAVVPTPQQHMQGYHQQQQAQQPQQHVSAQMSYQPSARAPVRPTPSPGIAQNASALNKDVMLSALQPSPTVSSSSKNATNTLALPLNLSAKTKLRQDESVDSIPVSSVTSTPSSTPRKRNSIENQSSNNSNDGSTNSALVAASTAPSTSSATNAKQPPNVSIIKNLLLNARGLAVPTGEGEDAVYNCPLCASTFRTAEDLQLHNSTYCQGASSAPISPVSSPSYRYFRSNSISLNLPELKNSIFRSRDPLPLAKLAWYQLRTKPSSLVLSRLSASQAGSSKATTTTTTSATSTAPTSSTSCSSVASCVASPRATPPTTAAPPAALILPDPSVVRFIDAPLPSPGPLLGKTPLVDFGNTSEARPRSGDVVITKMHEDRQFDEHTLAKRAKLMLDTSEPFVLGPAPMGSSGDGGLMPSTKRLNINSISGGDMQMLTHNTSVGNELGSSTSTKDERMRRFNSSGGCIIPISECSDVDKSPKMIRTPLLSGGSFQEMSPKPKEKENKSAAALSFANNTTFTTKLGLPGLGLHGNGPQHFQFPINPITAFNPLTLPPLQSGSGGVEKVIPHVPGIPGPNSLTPQLPPPQHLQLPRTTQMLQGGRSLSPNRKKTQSPMLMGSSASPKSLTLPTHESLKSLSPFGGVQNVPSEFERVPPPPGMRTARNWNQNLGTGATGSKLTTGSNSLDVPKKPFNFTRMADNVSPRKASNANVPKSSPTENEVRHFNFDHLTKEGGGGDGARTTSHAAQLAPLHVDINASAVGGAVTSCSGTEPTEAEQKKAKFLRPTSLPLKPGTFTPKRHHGITPTANTLPLISPETPRPSKSCVQLYLNGHAYTYLGLKCSTKMFYCTVNCPQPSYVAGAQKLSMYSVWQVCAENNPHPLGFKPKVVMSLYDSRQKTCTNTMAGTSKMPYSLVVSQQTVMTPFENNQGQWQHHQLKQITLITNSNESGDHLKKVSAGSTSSGSSGSSAGGMDGSGKKDAATGQMLVGGYESHEDYTYIRGRGRGRYVCSECGIRCKKPSMLKKHIRTHTDVRPYTCKHCNFSFKTKGNLTKHMQSKTHYKKCLELGINPGPMPADGVFLEPEPEFDQQSTTSAGGRTSSIPGESDSDDYSDNESESSDTDESKSRLLEHEAARCLLSLSMTPPIGQSISPHPRSEPYAYQQGERVNLSSMSFAGQTVVAATSTTAPTTTHSTHLTNIKRVISFSSPKPPFDYQKQEQYYSNPLESKPKHSNNSSTANYESAPIDLTKPRAVANPAPSPTVNAATANTACVVNDEYSTSTVVPLAGPPVQTQAQIRDVIFGGSNESGFLKTLISVSDKVRSSTETLENYKNGDELSQAYQYHKAFQYHKIKQIQMNRSFTDAINVTSLNQNFGTTPTLTTAVSAVGGGEFSVAFTTTTPSGSTGMRVSEGVVNTASAANVVQSRNADAVENNNSAAATQTRNASNEVARENVTADLQLPTIEVSAVPAPEVKNDSAVMAASAIPNSNNKPSVNALNVVAGSKQAEPTATALPYKSSDEGEDSEYISDQEQTAVAHTASKRSHTISNSTANANATAAEPHNAKLPAVVAQPGTTDFTGVLSTPGRTVVVGEDGLKKSGNNEIQPVYPRVRMSPDGRPVCKVCAKTFQTQGQLSLHMNIHYMERKFRCEPCGVSFRTQGHLQKHERAEAHKNKVMMTSTFGVPTTSNPRPFECTDCKIAFRIHGHLAKHLRSKTHVQKLECLQKLPFGTYAEIERAGISLTEIDTSDCENSLISLKTLAQKLIEKDPNKLGSYTTPSDMSGLGSVVCSGAVSAGVSSGVGTIVESTNTNTNHSAIVSQDSDSEDIFSAATMAAATAIASLDKDSAANTPRRANSTSEDEAIANGLNNNLKRRLPGNFSNGEDSDNPTNENCAVSSEKRARVSSLSSAGAVNAVAAVGSPASITSSNASSNN